MCASALMLTCATSPPMPTCDTDVFVQLADPPYSCRGGSEVAEYLEQTVSPHRRDVAERGRGSGSIKVRASFSTDGILDKYCLETSGTTEGSGQQVARRIRSSLVDRGPAPACLAGTRLLLLDIELQQGPGRDRNITTRETLHRGRREYLSRAEEECAADQDTKSRASATTFLEPILCRMDAEALLLSAKGLPAEEKLFFAPKDSRDVTPEDGDRIADLCTRINARTDLAACLESHGWESLAPDPAPF